MRLCALKGQYIIMNIVLLSAGLVVGAVVRGGRLVANPETTKEGHAQEPPGPDVQP